MMEEAKTFVVLTAQYRSDTYVYQGQQVKKVPVTRIRAKGDIDTTWHVLSVKVLFRIREYIIVAVTPSFSHV